MNRADVAGAGSFARKKQFVAEWLRKYLLRLEAIHWDIAVGAAAEWIIVPVMNVRSFKLRLEFRNRGMKNERQGTDCLIDEASFASEAIGGRSSGPTHQQRRAQRQLSPPGGNRCVRIMKKAGV